MATTDAHEQVSARIAVGFAADEVVTLATQGRWGLHNSGSNTAYFSTDGTAVVASDTTDNGGGALASGASITLVGCATLKLKCTGAETTVVTVTRIGER